MSDERRIEDLEAAVLALKEELIELRAELVSLSSEIEDDDFVN